MSIYPELDNLSVDDLIHKFSTVPLDGDEYGTLYYQEVADKICASGDRGIDFAMNFLMSNEASSEIYRLPALILAVSRYTSNIDNLESVLMKFLNGSQDSAIVASIEALSNQRNLGVKAQVLEKLSHSSPYVRSSVLRYMGQVYPKESIPLIIDSLQDVDYIVRESAIDELDEMEHEIQPERLRTLLEPLLDDPYPHVRQAAQTAIENLHLEDV